MKEGNAEENRFISTYGEEDWWKYLFNQDLWRDRWIKIPVYTGMKERKVKITVEDRLIKIAVIKEVVENSHISRCMCV